MTQLKTKKEIEIMEEGGKKLVQVKKKLQAAVVPGAVPQDLDRMAEQLILEAGGKPSFKMVKGYHWTTCINVNEGVVHGIPTSTPFQEGDLVSVDLGMFYKGFHTDTSFSKIAGEADQATKRFLEAGKEALNRAIKETKIGNKTSDISKSIQEVIKKYGYSPVRALTGHGVGRDLHEDPQIPCFWDGFSGEMIKEGMVLAVEVIYAIGKPDLVLEEDNWTISTKDAKIASLFEETVAVTNKGPLVLTT